jgi:hypothetical protein
MEKAELIRQAEEYEDKKQWQLALDIYEELFISSPEEIVLIEKTACVLRVSKYEHALNVYFNNVRRTQKAQNGFIASDTNITCKKDGNS